jgi:PAS domain S-box-containing protein/putative nucleotidyltransferase with HDIG domain
MSKIPQAQNPLQSETPFKGEVKLLRYLDSFAQNPLLRQTPFEGRNLQVLPETEDRLRDIIEYSSYLFYSHTPDHILTYVSPRTREYLDCEPEEALVRWTEFVTDHPINKEAFLHTQKAIDTGERQPPFELELLSKKGRRIWVEVSESPVVRNGKTVAIVGALADITSRKKGEEALRASEEKYRSILESIDEGYFEVDLAGNFTFFNDALCRTIGYPREELLGMNNRNYTTPETAKRMYQTFHQIYRTGKTASLTDYEILRKDAEVRIVSLSASLMRDSAGQPKGFRGVVRDLTERRRADKVLKESEERYRLLADNVTDIICAMDMDLRFTYVSPSATKILGYSVDEIMQGGLAHFLVPDSVENAQKALMEELDSERSGQENLFRVRTLELEGICKNRYIIWLEVRATFLRASDGRPKVILAVARDITDRKRAEQTLLESEKRYRQLFEHAPTGIYKVDFVNRKFLDVNDVVCEYTGYAKEELLSMNPLNILAEESQRSFLERLTKMIAGEKIPETVEYKIRKKDGKELWVLLNTEFIKENGFPKGATVVVHDITEHKLSEEAIRQSEERYRLLVDNANDAIFIAQDGRIKFPNPKTVQILGYSLEELQQIHYMDVVHPDDRAIVSLERDKRRTQGIPSTTYSLRVINKDGHQLWAQIGSVSILWEKRPATLNFVRDITVQRIAEEKLRQTVKKLRKITGATIQAMAQTVEVRDPYTAGHQKRVANLARAIALHMGLSSEQVDGIRMAGLIHDIGKISVPAEILSKPGVLTDLEFAFMKTHPQVGHDILKEIEFPWDIAGPVLQHHERLDGSGYPQGLVGGDILLASRILAVADVVEAMASHRPYRPSIGLEKALDEISGKKGTLYDRQVVDACLTLFAEKNFEFRW